MRSLWSVAAAVGMVLGAIGPAGAEVLDAGGQVPASGLVSTTTSLTITARNISDDSTASGVDFPAASASTTAPWVRSPQYLQVQHQSNQSNWAIRILTNNRGTFTNPPMEGRVLNPGPTDSPDDDQLSYSGLVGDPANPNARAPLAWQVFTDPVSGGPAVPADAQVGGAFDSPWAFLADASDCTSQCRSASPVTVDKTIEFFRVAQGDATQGFLLLHPNVPPRTADGNIAVYLAARLGGVPSGTYSSNILLELYHF